MTATAKKFGRDLDLNSNKIQNLVDPTSAQDATTKNFIEVTKHASVDETNTGTEDSKYITPLVQAQSSQLDQGGTKVYAVASGTDTYVATLAPVITAYNKSSVRIKFTNANTTSSTLNLNGIGAITIKKTGGVNLIAGDIIAGDIYTLTYDGTNWFISLGGTISPNALKGCIDVTFENGGAVLTTGLKGIVRVPYNGTITGWSISETSDTPISSSIVVDIWKDIYANYPPTIADTICGADKPTLVSGIVNQNLTLTLWTIPVVAGDYVAVHIDSVSLACRVNLQIHISKTN